MSHRPEKKLPLVVITGRTNVGKSTFFNALVEKRQALISNVAGTTRDSNLGLVEWGGNTFDLVDTAGIINNKELKKVSQEENDIDIQSQKQAQEYLDQADLILFLVDTKAGLLPEDQTLANQLKNKKKYANKTFLIANKTDSFRLAPETAEFNHLNLGEPYIISAANGLGTGDLLDAIIKRLKDDKKLKTSKKKEIATEQADAVRVAIIGKPNVGKSSLLNAILGYERVIVSPVPHTTREPQNTKITYKNQTIKLVDTAGIARHSRNSIGMEKHGILKSLKSLDQADIALLVLDISEDLTHQDAKLVQEIIERGKSLVFILNKWDKVELRDTKKWKSILYDKMSFALWAPIQFISAKTGEKVNKILDLILTISEQRKLSLSESQCEKFMKAVVKIHKPAKGKGTKAPRIYEFNQISSNPPAFTVRIGAHDDLHFSYVRFMENRLRERHGFIGTPIRVKVSKEKKSHTTYNY
ncbi:ribosome biogenesis GTPase Der [Candidatus Falkowbacteria bacterium CG10_big_fil_rev_8_21_14_0_10_37_18]|uniref:GTPase Der n=1 Tax=Candidatus Falkowbacteria bacterium CG10_big_fil_rev_8_21_14_0_10_37_18 TaxID=1974562 RepID=A0A2H0V8R1_9BACT|nr:MAG: ribosome biogenesis GTPase Der [Candidatus Falkowbacteria bacterium CG10_big_fil_rev_8_21_14_0_10_37_18]